MESGHGQDPQQPRLRIQQDQPTSLLQATAMRGDQDAEPGGVDDGHVAAVEHDVTNAQVDGDLERIPDLPDIRDVESLGKDKVGPEAVTRHAATVCACSPRS